MRGSYPNFRDLDRDLKNAAKSFNRYGNPLESGEFTYVDLICKLKTLKESPEDEEN